MNEDFITWLYAYMILEFWDQTDQSYLGVIITYLVFKAMECREYIQKEVQDNILGQLQLEVDRGRRGTKGKSESTNISMKGITYTSLQ